MAKCPEVEGFVALLVVFATPFPISMKKGMTGQLSELIVNEESGQKIILMVLWIILKLEPSFLTGYLIKSF